MIWICIKNVFVNTVLHLKNMLKFVMFVCFVHYLSSVHDNMLKYRIFQQYTVNTLKTLNNIGFSWSSLLGINIVRIAMTCFLFYYAIFLGVYVWLTGIFFPLQFWFHCMFALVLTTSAPKESNERQVSNSNLWKTATIKQNIHSQMNLLPNWVVTEHRV